MEKALLTRKQEILNELNDQQKQPVLNYTGPSAVIAGPGSGKTHCLVSRAAFMVENGVPASKMLLFTFTKKAANEIKERVMRYVGEAGARITVSTYHSFCARLLRKYAGIVGYGHNFTIIDGDDQLKMIRKVMDKNKEFKPAEVVKQISRWKENMVSTKQAVTLASAAENSERMLQIAEWYETYQQNLFDMNTMDYDDLIYFVIRVFENNSGALQEVNEQYHYIIADECQDSSPRDLKLIKFLAGKRMNVCCVGDDDQSIYGFRGANIEAFYKFVDAMGMKKFILGQNYRSTKTIVDAAQSLIRNNGNRIEKNLFSENPRGTKIIHHESYTQQQEAQYVVKAIMALVRNGSSYEDIAILYRLSKLSRAVEDALIREHIPYLILSGCAFYSRMEIKDMLSYLNFLTNPSDFVSLGRALNVPKRGLGEKSIEKIINACQATKKCGNIDAESSSCFLKRAVGDMGLKGKALKSIQQFIAIMEQLEEYSLNHDSGETVERLVSITGYEDYLEETEKEDAADRIENLRELVSIARDFETMEEFLENMTLNDQESESLKDVKGVKLMTIHASKGLEFRNVLIVGCNQGSLPSLRSIEEGNLQEERRLMYVGMTRAKEQLFLTNTKTVAIKGQLFTTTRSQFIDEVGSSFIFRHVAK